MAESSFLQLQTDVAVECHLHPVVLFEILDHFTRRNQDQKRVIGALLGSVASDGTVTLKNSFPIPQDDVSHQEFGMFFNTMHELHQKVNAREQLVGWYATGDKDEVAEDDAAIHAFFEDRTGDKSPCVCLKVDANIGDASKIGIGAFTSTNMSLPGGEGGRMLGKCFSRVKCEIKTYEAQRIGVDFITQNTIGQGGGEELGSELEKLEGAILKLIDMTETTIGHVDGVLAGKEAADTKIGRALAESVSAVPRLDMAEFEGTFSKRVQDLLMVQYLAAIAKTQVTFWHRMQGMA
uniref:MPN domain-containing protein n=1 Tax=Hemiselmis tepida TaxID=464990 RepID=A0A7S0W7Y8_9CRYP